MVKWMYLEKSNVWMWIDTDRWVDDHIVNS